MSDDLLGTDDAAVLADAVSTLRGFANSYGGITDRSKVHAAVAADLLNQFLISLKVWDESENADTALYRDDA